MTTARTTLDDRLADDLLDGAQAIADFVFPASNDVERAANRRKVYRFASSPENRLPVFRIGGRLFARKSTIRRWVERQECGLD